MEDIDCIVSLTSWKGRINCSEVPKAIYSILRQKTKYKFKVVLVLSKLEFPNGVEELPTEIKLFYENALIEILWTEDNLKAYKKLYPTMQKYSNLPIMTTDDDIILRENCVETFMNKHRENPNAILAERSHHLLSRDETVPYMFRLFPPNSLFNLDKSYYTDVYNGCEDDVYISILSKLKGTRTITLNSGLMYEMRGSIQATGLHHIYSKSGAQKYRENLIHKLKIDGVIG